MSADTSALDGALDAAAQHARVMGDRCYDCAGCGARVDWREVEWDDGSPLCGECGT